MAAFVLTEQKGWIWAIVDILIVVAIVALAVWLLNKTPFGFGKQATPVVVANGNGNGTNRGY